MAKQVENNSYLDFIELANKFKLKIIPPKVEITSKEYAIIAGVGSITGTVIMSILGIPVLNTTSSGFLSTIVRGLIAMGFLFLPAILAAAFILLYKKISDIQTKDINKIIKFISKPLYSLLGFVSGKPKIFVDRNAMEIILSGQIETIQIHYVNLLLLIMHINLYCSSLAHQVNNAGKNIDTLREIWSGIAPGINEIALATQQKDERRAYDGALQLVEELQQLSITPLFIEKETKFNNAMAEKFLPYGLIEETQPVETLKPAWLLKDEVIIKGQIRRYRSNQ